MAILKYEDLCKIAQFMVDNGYDKYGLTIKSVVHTKESINKINEDFFYRFKKDKDDKSTPIECDQVNVNIGGVTFNYSLKENKDVDNT